MSDNKPPQPDPAVPSGRHSGRIGRYKIQGLLGKGSMGVVYHAHDPALERSVALKVMSPQIADDDELKARFQREAKAVARMTHPNVVAVFDLGEHTDGSPYIAMELLKGRDLLKQLRQPPPLTLDRRIAIVVQVLSGLTHAHQAGIVHRDIKPANIFLNEDGAVKIMDFGVARLTSAAMTGTGHVVGTADYMSPEQIKGAKVDGRSDLFSVGSVLFELASGRRPFHTDSLMAIFYKITHDEPDYDLLPAGEEYAALTPILRRALTKNVDGRYQTAQEFGIDLRGYLSSHATSSTGRHALENLLDLEAPTSPPTPLTASGRGPGTTLVQAEDSTLGQANLSASGPTGAPSATLRFTQTPTVAGALPSQRAERPKPPGPRVPPRRPPSHPMTRPLRPRPVRPARSRTPALLGLVVAVAAVGIGGFFYLQASGRLPGTAHPGTSPPSPVVPTGPPPTAPAVATLGPSARPVETTPPVPTTVAAAPASALPAVDSAAASRRQARGRARRAQSAFARQDYDGAQRHAQAALVLDASNAEAAALVKRARKGQEAHRHLASAEEALGRADFAAATAALDTASGLAPWDSRVTALEGRIREAQAATEVEDFLGQADTALEERRFAEAGRLYDEALKLNPKSTRARIGRTGALAARAAATGASGSFKAGATTARAAEGSSSGSLPPGFEKTPEVKVQRGTQRASLPGKVLFDVTPKTVKPGDRYRVRISLRNEGSAPIRVARLVVATTVNGRRSRGAVPASVKEIAPRQTALLREVSDVWRGEIQTWSMEVSLFTGRGDRYTNILSWK